MSASASSKGLAVACAASALVCGLAATGVEPARRKTERANKTEKVATTNTRRRMADEVSLELAIAPQLRIGSPMELAMTVANHRSDEIEFFYVDGYELDLHVFDEAGSPVALTDRGEQFVRRNWPLNVVLTRQILRTVKPGEQRQWKYDIEPLFRFAPGKYTLSVEIHFLKPARTHIAVRDLSFKVR